MTERPRPAFADRLNRLFDTVLHPEGRPYKNSEVAEKIAASGKGTLSVRRIQQMRSTDPPANPSLSSVELIAGFFGVPTAYFFDDQVEADLDAEATALRVAMHNAGIRQVALRADGLSPEGLELLRGVIERVRKAEGLSDG